MHFNNCLVWLSCKIRHQKITENCSDCGEDFWCSPAQPSRTVVRKIAQKITLDPSHHFLNFCHLQSPKYPDSQAQEPFLSPRQFTAKYFPHCVIKICAITLYEFVTTYILEQGCSNSVLEAGVQQTLAQPPTCLNTPAGKFLVCLVRAWLAGLGLFNWGWSWNSTGPSLGTPVLEHPCISLYSIPILSSIAQVYIHIFLLLFLSIYIYICVYIFLILFFIVSIFYLSMYKNTKAVKPWLIKLLLLCLVSCIFLFNKTFHNLV